MDPIPAPWRPRAQLRAISIAVVWREGRLLAAAVIDDAGAVRGWRPLGGGIAFGETSAAAVQRELAEELGARFVPERRLGVLENLFHHQGHMGHEIVVVWEGRLADPGQAAADRLVLRDQAAVAEAAWVPWEDFASGRATLFPDGLAALIADTLRGPAPCPIPPT
ncbi:NUDIX domain-containing protein [Rhodobacteraceae bacterium CCMM004]|nr:NUDIX domain-containing protein [Rhodobacteraceae bacterium CCMM004]